MLTHTLPGKEEAMRMLMAWLDGISPRKKKTDFREIDYTKITRIEYALNTRPRKRLGWKTPLEVFSKELNLINSRININISMPSVAVAG